MIWYFCGGGSPLLAGVPKSARGFAHFGVAAAGARASASAINVLKWIFSASAQEKIRTTPTKEVASPQLTQVVAPSHSFVTPAMLPVLTSRCSDCHHLHRRRKFGWIFPVANLPQTVVGGLPCNFNLSPLESIARFLKLQIIQPSLPKAQLLPVASTVDLSLSQLIIFQITGSSDSLS
jgi:hypothetical protein